MQKMLLPGETDSFQIQTEQGAAPFFSLVDFLRVLRVRRNIILVTAVAVVSLAVVAVLEITPRYSSTAMVMLDQRKNSVADANASLTGLSFDSATVQNQVQILTSLELADRVAQKLKLKDDPEFNPEVGLFGVAKKYINPFNWFPGGGNSKAAASGLNPEDSQILHRVISNLTVSPEGQSTAIKVSYSSTDPVKSARMANTIAQAYVEDQLEAKFEASKTATQWLAGRIHDLSKQAQDADSAVQRYKAEHNITQTLQGSIVEQQTAAISGQLVLAKADLAEKQSRYSNLLALKRNGQAANSQAVLSSVLISTLRGQQSDLDRQIADLSTRYLPNHPKLVNLKAQKDNLEQKINEEIDRVVESVRNDASSAGAHVASLQGSLSSAETQGQGENQSQVQLTALQSAATSARSMYEAFLGRLNQTQGEEGIQTPDARIISKAEIPSSPSFPQKGLTIGLAIPIGLIFGLILAFAAEGLDSGYRTAAQVEAVLGYPVMAVVPEVKAAGGIEARAADLLIEKPMSSFAESIRGLQLGLSLAHVDKQPKVIAVTSSVPGEGKTTISISLARAAARGGQRTLLIDGDLRRPNVTKTMGLENPAGGLIEILTDKMPLEQCLIKDPKSDTLILPCLKTPPNPADLLMSQAMRNLLTHLRKVFDVIIIDSAPVLPVNDSKVIAKISDAVLFVVRWEKTPREATINAMRSLADVHAPISGVALGRADSERFQYYSYGYQSYYNYNKYYSE